MCLGRWWLSGELEVLGEDPSASGLSVGVSGTVFTERTVCEPTVPLRRDRWDWDAINTCTEDVAGAGWGSRRSRPGPD